MTWIRPLSRQALIAGGVASALALLGILLSGKDQFFRSYLLAFAFWFGIAFGCLGIQMIHALTGGRWGTPVMRFSYAASTTLPILGALFLPILLGFSSLYPWARPEAASDPVLVHKAPYLNIPFFIARALLCFAAWIALSQLLYKRAVARGIDRPASDKMRALSGPGILVLAITMTLAAIDWLMSLDPHWFSTMFAVIVMVGQLLSGMCFVVAALVLVAAREESDVSRDALHDLGNMMLVFTMLWAYTSFSQYLIIYAGNVSEDVPFYVHRAYGGWQHVGVALILLHFTVPFLVLLSRRSKRSTEMMVRVALGVLAMRLVDLFWMTAPSFSDRLRVHWMDLVLPIAIGGIWLWYFLRRLSLVPLPATR